MLCIVVMALRKSPPDSSTSVLYAWCVPEALTMRHSEGAAPTPQGHTHTRTSSDTVSPSAAAMCLRRAIIDSCCNGLNRNLAHRDAMGSIILSHTKAPG